MERKENGSLVFETTPFRSINIFRVLSRTNGKKRKTPRKCLSQFHSMKRGESESFQEFSDRFMKVYNAIPSQFKPPLVFAQLQYAEAFDSEFTLWLSERRSASLDDVE